MSKQRVWTLFFFYLARLLYEDVLFFFAVLHSVAEVLLQLYHPSRLPCLHHLEISLDVSSAK
jgi:hypothetical protein